MLPLGGHFYSAGDSMIVRRFSVALNALAVPQMCWLET